MSGHDPKNIHCIWNRPKDMMPNQRYACRCALIHAIETLEKLRASVAELQLALLSATRDTTQLFKDIQGIADAEKETSFRSPETTPAEQVPGL